MQKIKKILTLRTLGILLFVIGLSIMGVQLYNVYNGNKIQSDILAKIKEGEEASVDVKLSQKDVNGNDIIFTAQVDTVLVVPDINLNIPVLTGGNIMEVLEVSAGTLSNKPVGQGNYSIAGHHTMYKNNHFSNVMNLKGGELAYVYTKTEKYTFKLNQPFKVNENEVWVLDDKDVPMITLVTCETPEQTEVRVIVQGTLVSVEPTDKPFS